MTIMVRLQPGLSRALALAVIPALGFGIPDSFAAPVLLKNAGRTPVQIGFDGGPVIAIAPRDSLRLSLEGGEHSATCRFEGAYDACNIEDRFTLDGTRPLTISLRPAFTLRHAVALAQAGMLSVETRRDGAWATTTLELPGAASDCVDFSAGTLGSVSKRVRGGLPVQDVTLQTQHLCGEPWTVIGSTVGGQPLYFQPRFLWFRDTAGHLVLVKP